MKFHTTSYAVYPSHDVPMRRAQKNPKAHSNHENTRQSLVGRNCIGYSACTVQELSRFLRTRNDKPKWSQTIGTWQLNAIWYPAFAPTIERTWIEKKSWSQKKVWSLVNSNASEFWPIAKVMPDTAWGTHRNSVIQIWNSQIKSVNKKLQGKMFHDYMGRQERFRAKTFSAGYDLAGHEIRGVCLLRETLTCDLKGRDRGGML